MAVACLVLAGVGVTRNVATRLRARRERGVIDVLLANDFEMSVGEAIPIAVAERRLGSTPWKRWETCDPEARRGWSEVEAPHSSSSGGTCVIGPLAWKVRAGYDNMTRASYSYVEGPFTCVIEGSERGAPPEYQQPSQAARFEYRTSADSAVAEYRCTETSEGIGAPPALAAARSKYVPVRSATYCARAALALLLAAVFAAVMQSRSLRRDLARPWHRAVRVSDDRAQLDDGRLVVIDRPRAGWPPTTDMLLILEEQSGVPYRDGETLRAIATRTGTMEALREASSRSERRRWQLVAALALLSPIVAWVGRFVWATANQIGL